MQDECYQRRKPQPHLYRRKESQTCPRRRRRGDQPDRKIDRVVARDHEPEGKKENASPRRDPRGTGSIIISSAAQDENPRRAMQGITDPTGFSPQTLLSSA